MNKNTAPRRVFLFCARVVEDDMSCFPDWVGLQGMQLDVVKLVENAV